MRGVDEEGRSRQDHNLYTQDYIGTRSETGGRHASIADKGGRMKPTVCQQRTWERQDKETGEGRGVHISKANKRGQHRTVRTNQSHLSWAMDLAKSLLSRGGRVAAGERGRCSLCADHGSRYGEVRVFMPSAA